MSKCGVPPALWTAAGWKHQFVSVSQTLSSSYTPLSRYPGLVRAYQHVSLMGTSWSPGSCGEELWRAVPDTDSHSLSFWRTVESLSRAALPSCDLLCSLYPGLKTVQSRSWPGVYLTWWVFPGIL